MLKEGDGGCAVDDYIHLSAGSFQVSSTQAAVLLVHIALHHNQLAQDSLQRVLAAGVLPEERPASEQGLEARLACTTMMSLGGNGLWRRNSKSNCMIEALRDGLGISLKDLHDSSSCKMQPSGYMAMWHAERACMPGPASQFECASPNSCLCCLGSGRCIRLRRQRWAALMYCAGADSIFAGELWQMGSWYDL